MSFVSLAMPAGIQVGSQTEIPVSTAITTKYTASLPKCLFIDALIARSFARGCTRNPARTDVDHPQVRARARPNVQASYRSDAAPRKRPNLRHKSKERTLPGH